MVLDKDGNPVKEDDAEDQDIDKKVEEEEEEDNFIDNLLADIEDDEEDEDPDEDEEKPKDGYIKLSDLDEVMGKYLGKKEEKKVDPKESGSEIEELKQTIKALGDKLDGGIAGQRIAIQIAQMEEKVKVEYPDFKVNMDLFEIQTTKYGLTTKQAMKKQVEAETEKAKAYGGKKKTEERKEDDPENDGLPANLEGFNPNLHSEDRKAWNKKYPSSKEKNVYWANVDRYVSKTKK